MTFEICSKKWLIDKFRIELLKTDFYMSSASTVMNTVGKDERKDRFTIVRNLLV